MIGMWVPVEVLLYAAKLVERRFKEYGSKPMLRQGLRKDVSVITDNRNFVMDMDFRVIVDPSAWPKSSARSQEWWSTASSTPG